MKVTMIRDDNLVIIDGVGLSVDLSDMPADLHAVQWYGDAGHIERQGMMNQPINSLADFQTWISRWNAAAAEAANQPDPEPVQIAVATPWQMRKALNQLGLRPAVEAAVAASDQETKDGWEFADEFRRDNVLIASVAAALGKTDADIDALFALAMTL